MSRIYRSTVKRHSRLALYTRHEVDPGAFVERGESSTSEQGTAPARPPPAEDPGPPPGPIPWAERGKDEPVYPRESPPGALSQLVVY